MTDTPKPGTPLPWEMHLEYLTEHDWLQIEQAASGCISGDLDEWPDLMSALRRAYVPYSRYDTARYGTAVCKLLVSHRQLAELAKPCVWKYHRGYSSWIPSCINLICGVKREAYCQYCGHKVELHPREEATNAQ